MLRIYKMFVTVVLILMAVVFVVRATTKEALTALRDRLRSI